MSANPVEAEARGQEYIEATFSGETFRLPLDVDSWPLDEIRTCVGIHKDSGRVVINHAVLVGALRRLLGEDQWPRFTRAAPKRRQHAPAANAFAAAVGFASGKDQLADTDVVFGALPRFLALLSTYPEKIESDLDRFWNIDYRNRFRMRRGRRRLTLRQIYVRLSNLPRESSLAIALNGGKLLRTGEELVLMDLYEAITRKRHPSRPMTAEQKKQRAEQAEKDKKHEAEHRARMQKRKAGRQAAGIESARANARREQEREAAHAQVQA